MLVFPERVLKGDIPNRDFLHLYGPGSLWALAGVFKVFGVSLLTQRAFALGQQLAIVAGVYLLARRWNRALATAGAVSSALIIIPFGLTALAWVGAAGLGLLGLAAGVEARAACRRTGCPPIRDRGGSVARAGRVVPARPRRRGRPLDRRARLGHRSETPQATAHRIRDRPDAVSHPPRDRRTRQRGARDGAGPDLQPPGRPQPPTAAVVVALRRVLAEGRLVATAVVADPGCDGPATAVHLVLPPDRGRGVPAGPGLAAHAHGPHVAPGAHAARRRALQRRHPPAGRATRRLRTLRVGRLRTVRLPAGRALRARRGAACHA